MATNIAALQSIPHAGCGAESATAPTVAPAGGVADSYGGGFAIPQFGAATAMPIGNPERFVSSMSGGVMLDAQGAPAGRVPEGSFVDMKDGKIYGPDSKPLTVPEGSTVDFFDLPSIEDLQKDFTAMTAFAERNSTDGGGVTVADKGGAPDKGAPMKTAVDGQWGPGGVTEFKGGAAGVDDGCGMDHSDASAPASKGGGSTTTATDPTGTLVGGASGGGDVAAPDGLASIMQALQAAMAQISGLTGASASTAVAGASGGGATDAVTGTSKLGTVPTLQSSLDELIAVLKELVDAVQAGPIGGGAPDKGAPDKGAPVPNRPHHDHDHRSHGRPGQAGPVDTTAVAAASGTDASTSTDTSTSTSDENTSTDTSTDTSTT